MVDLKVKNSDAEYVDVFEAGRPLYFISSNYDIISDGCYFYGLSYVNENDEYFKKKYPKESPEEYVLVYYGWEDRRLTFVDKVWYHSKFKLIEMISQILPPSIHERLLTIHFIRYLECAYVPRSNLLFMPSLDILVCGVVYKDYMDELAEGMRKSSVYLNDCNDIAVRKFGFVKPKEMKKIRK